MTRNYKKTIKKIGSRALILFMVFSMLFSNLPPEFLNIQNAEAAVTSNGNMLYGDTTNPGTLKSILFTNPGTFGAENPGDATSASNIVHLTAKTSPTRDEIMVGHLKVDGRLDVLTCTGSTGCDAAAEHTPQWNNPGTTATQDCDAAPTIGTCVQSFDLGYEALSGNAMVVYTDTTAATVYYASYNGSTWSPNSTPGTPGVSNDIITNTGGAACAGTIRWVRVVPAGENLADDRSNSIMLLVADSNNDLCAFYWDGGAWDSGTTLFTNLVNCDRARCFDGNWQGARTFVVSYTTAAASEIRYQKYVVGSGWTVSDTLAYSLASAGEWVSSAADPTSSRIYVTTASSGNDTRGAVWRADDATDGWTVCASGGCPDTAIETVAGNQANGVFERFNGEALHVYNDAGTTNTPDYMTYNGASTWGASTTLGFTSTDDLQSIRAIASANSDDIFIMVEDVDCDMDARMWNGSALQTISSNFELLASNTNNGCANTAPIEGMGNGYSYDFAWRFYSPWARNWRFYSGADTAATPTTSLAAENTTPSDFDYTSGKARLRYSVAELTSGASQTDARKKLQYTTDNPDSHDAVWVDVDDTGGGGSWRYVDCNGGAGTCDDNTALSGTVLSGSPTAGWWTQDKDVNTGGTAMDHNAGQLRELEYSIEANNANPNTTYYFRMYDLDQQTPVFREQDNDGANDCATAVCTYPSLTTRNPQTTAGTSGTQTASIEIGATNQYVGGLFSFSTNGAVNVTNITITESGTVDGTNLDNIKLYYETDTSATCANVSYGGGESQYGSTDADGFSAADGTASFSGSVSISPTSTLCVYVVLDVTSGTASQTIELSIASTANYTVSVGTKSGTPSILDTTTLVAPALTVAGNAYEDEATTALTVCDGSGAMIAVSVNGAAASTGICADANGSFSINTGISAPAAGTPIHIWIDGATACNANNANSCGATIIRYSGSGNITDAIVRRNIVIIRDDDGTGVSNANIGVRDNANDADIPYDVDGSNNIVVEDGIKVIVGSGDTYAPAGNITTSPSASSATVDGDFAVAGTLTLTGNALSIGGDFINSGTFSYSGGQTTTFTATGTGHTIEDGTNNFDTLVFNGSGGGWTLSSALTTVGDLTITAGNLTVGATDLTVGGNTSITGTLTISSSTGTKNFTGDVTIETGGTWNNSGGEAIGLAGSITNNGTFTSGSGAYTMSGASKTINAATSINFSNLTISGTIQNNTTLYPTQLVASGSPTLTNGATGIIHFNSGLEPFSGGTLDASTVGNTVSYGAATNLTCKNTTYHHLIITGGVAPGGVITCPITTVNGDLTYSRTQSTTWTTTSSITVGGTFTTSGSGTFTNDTAYTFTAPNVSMGAAMVNNGITTISTSLSGAGGFTNSATGTLNIGFASAPTITTLTATASGNIVNYTAASPNCKVTTYNILNFTGSGNVTCAVTTVTNDISLSGTVSWTTTSSINLTDTLTVGNGTALVNGAYTLIAPNVTVTGTGTLTNNGTTTISTSLGGTGTFTNGATGTLNIGFAAVPGITTLTASASGNTVSYTNANPNCKVTTYHHLTFTSSGTITCAATTVNGNLGLVGGALWSIEANLSIGGDLNFWYGVLSQGSFTISVAGDAFIGNVPSGSFIGGDGAVTLNGDLTISSTGSWTKGAGTVTFGGGAAQVITDNTDPKQDLGVVVTANASTSVSTATNIKLTSLNVVGSTTWDITGDTMTITGTSNPLTVSGTFTTTGSTVDFIGNGASAILATTYNNLGLKPSGASQQVLGAGTFTINGNLTIGNGTNNGATASANDPVINVIGNTTVASGATYTVGTGMLSVSGDLTVNGTVTEGDSGSILVNGSVLGVGTMNLFGGTSLEQRVSADESFGTSSGTNLWRFYNLTFSNSSGASRTITTDSGGTGFIYSANQMLIGKSGDTHATVLNAGDRYWYMGENLNPFVILSSPQAVFTPNTSTVEYIATSTQNVAASTYNNLILNNFGLANFVLPNADITILGDFIGLESSDNGNITKGSGTIIFAKGGEQNLSNDFFGTDLGNIRISANGTNTTLVSISSIKATNLTIDADQTLSMGATVLELTGTGTPFTNNGIFSYGTSQVWYTGEGATITPMSGSAGTNGYYTLASYGNTVSPHVFGSGTFQINNNLIIGNGVSIGATGDANDPNINVTGVVTVASGADFTTGSGTITIAGVTNPLVLSGTLTASTGNTINFTGNSATGIPAATYYNLGLKPSGLGTQTLNSGTYNISGDLTIGDGSNSGASASTNDPTINVTGSVIIATGAPFISTGGVLTIGNDFTNGGSFTHDSGTVNLNTTNTATITGATTFYNFNVTGIGAPKTIQFEAGTIFSFDGPANSFVITGTAGNLITITSTTTARWLADFANTQNTVTYVHLQHSGCSASAVVTMDGTSTNDATATINDSDCWYFPVIGVAISGTIYSDDGSSAYNCSTGNVTVRVAKNGSLSQSVSCTAGGGTYTIPTITGASAGDVITLFIDNATASKQASLVTKLNDGTSPLTLNLYQQRVIVRNENGVATTNTNMGAYDSADNANIMFTESAGNLTIASGNKLIVWTGDTFTPGGTVATTTSGTSGNPDGDILIQGGATLSMGTNALSVGGDFTNSGTFSYGGGQTTTFTATGTGHAIEDGTNNFDTVVFNGSGGGWTLSSALTTVGNVTITAGNLTVGATDLTVGGNTSITGTLTISSNTGTKNFTGDVTVNASGTWNNSGNEAIGLAGNLTNNQTFTAGSGVYTMSGSSKTINGTISIPNLTISGTVTNNNALTVSTALSGAGTLTNASGATLYIGGTSGITGLTATASGNTVVYNGVAPTIKATTYDDLTISVGAIASVNSPITVNDTLTISSGVMANNSTLTITGNLTGAGTLNNSATGTLNIGFSSAPSITSLSVGTSGNIVNYTAANPNCQVTTYDTLNFTGSGTVTCAVTSVTNDINLSGTVSWTTTSGISVTDTLTVGNGTALINGSYTLTAPNVTVTGTGSLTNNGTLTVSTVLGGTGTVTNGATGTLNIGQATEPLTSGTLSTSTSGNTVNYTAASPNCKVTTYHHLNFTGSGTVSCAVTTINGNLGTSGTVSYTTGANLAIGGNLTVGNGTTLTQGAFILSIAGTTTIGGGATGVFVGSAGALTLNGDLVLSSGSTWTKGAGVVTFSKGAAQTITDNTASKQDLGDVATATASTAVSTATNVRLTSLNVAASTTWDIAGDTLTIRGTTNPLVVSGTFTTTNSTVDFIGNGATGIPALTYNNLGLKPSNTSAQVLGSGTFTINGTLTVGAGAAGATAATNNPVVNVTGATIISSGAVFSPGSGAINLASDLTVNGTLSGSGSGTVTVNGNVGGSGTISLTGNTFEQRVSSNKTFGSTSGFNNWAFNNLTFSNSATDTTITITTNSSFNQIIVNGTLSIGKTGDDATGAGSPTILDAGEFRPWVMGGASNQIAILSSPQAVLEENLSTFRFTGNGATIPALTYYSLDLKPDGASPQVLASGTFTINQGFIIGDTINAGATAATNNPIINVGGNMTINSGATFTHGNGALSITGSLGVDGTLSGSGNGYISLDGGFGGSGTVNLTENTVELIHTLGCNSAGLQISGSNNWTFNNIIFSNGSLCSTMNTNLSSGFGIATLTIQDQLLIGKAGDTYPTQVTFGGTIILESTGTPLVILSSPQGRIHNEFSSSTVRYTGAGATIASTPYVVDELLGNTYSSYYNLELDPNGSTPQVLQAGLFTLYGSLTIGGNLLNPTTITAATNDPDINLPNGNMTIEEYATFITGDGDIDIQVASLDVAGILTGSGSGTITTGQHFWPTGEVNLTGGTFKFAPQFNKIFGPLGDPLHDVDWTFYNLVFSAENNFGSTVTIDSGPYLTSVTVLNNLSIGQNLDTQATRLQAGDAIWILQGATTPLSISSQAPNLPFSLGFDSILEAENSTFRFTGNGVSVPALVHASSYWNNLELEPSGASPQILPSGTLNINGYLSVGNGTNAGATASANNPTINIDGALSIASNASFVSTSDVLTLGDDFTNNGTFTHNNGSVVVSMSSGLAYDSVFNITGSNGINFNNFSMNAPNKTLRFKAGNTYGFAGDLSLTGAGSQNLLLNSDTNTVQWLMDFTGVDDGLNFLTIKDSGCAPGSSQVFAGFNSANQGNNGTCFRFLAIGGGSVSQPLEAPDSPPDPQQGNGGGSAGGGGGGVEGGGGGEGTGGGGAGGGGGEDVGYIFPNRNLAYTFGGSQFSIFNLFLSLFSFL